MRKLFSKEQNAFYEIVYTVENIHISRKNVRFYNTLRLLNVLNYIFNE